MTDEQIEEIVMRTYPKLSDVGACDYLKLFRDKLRVIIKDVLDKD